MQQGTAWSDAHLPYLIATAEKALEKALIDTLYLSTRKNRRFARLPEVALEQTSFTMREFKRFLDQLPIPPRISTAMQARAEMLFHMSTTKKQNASNEALQPSG